MSLSPWRLAWVRPWRWGRRSALVCCHPASGEEIAGVQPRSANVGGEARSNSDCLSYFDREGEMAVKG